MLGYRSTDTDEKYNKKIPIGYVCKQFRRLKFSHCTSKPNNLSILVLRDATPAQATSFMM